jgi:hypothetical protein
MTCDNLDGPAKHVTAEDILAYHENRADSDTRSKVEEQAKLPGTFANYWLRKLNESLGQSSRKPS